MMLRDPTFSQTIEAVVSLSTFLNIPHTLSELKILKCPHALLMTPPIVMYMV